MKRGKKYKPNLFFKKIIPKKGFIENGIKTTVDFLLEQSLFKIILRKLQLKNDSGFVELWVVANLLLALFSVFIIEPTKFGPLWIFLLWPIYRMMEMVLYLVNVALFTTRVDSIQRSIILLIFNYLEILFWFAFIYLKLDLVSSSLSAIYFSVITMTTIGYGDIAPTLNCQKIAVVFHSAISLLLTLIIFSRLLSWFHDNIRIGKNG